MKDQAAASPTAAETEIVSSLASVYKSRKLDQLDQLTQHGEIAIVSDEAKAGSSQDDEEGPIRAAPKAVSLGALSSDRMAIDAGGRARSECLLETKAPRSGDSDHSPIFSAPPTDGDDGDDGGVGGALWLGEEHPHADPLESLGLLLGGQGYLGADALFRCEDVGQGIDSSGATDLLTQRLAESLSVEDVDSLFEGRPLDGPSPSAQAKLETKTGKRKLSSPWSLGEHPAKRPKTVAPAAATPAAAGCFRPLHKRKLNALALGGAVADSAPKLRKTASARLNRPPDGT